MTSKTRHPTAKTTAAAMPSGDPALLKLSSILLWQAAQLDTPEAFLAEAVQAVATALAADFVAIVALAGGRWLTIAATEPVGQPLPIDLLATVLDRETPLPSDDWAAAPLAPRSEEGELLLIHLPTMPSLSASVAKGPERTCTALSAIGQIAPVLHQALATVRRRARQDRKLRRLEAILEIANQWNQTNELEPLLIQMAEAAARLLGADRASIFLWDRPNHTLVGRPALGLPDGELRIRDDRGVVGEVIRTGEPRRVDATIEPEAVDHHVDTQLRYQTRTLLCVPLRGRSGELFGAFELINKLVGVFTKEDEEALAELAGHAAVSLENAQDRRQLLTANRHMADQAAEKVRLIGESPAVEALRSIVRRVADTDLAVLILGENGTGKEVVAQSIHYLSRRRDQPFIAVNCAAIPESLAESELFGHEKGAFTDAREARQGKFELAAGGTLFLDEIGDLSLSGQAKLLRVIEEKVLVRVGGSTPIHTDARLLAATNQNLAEMVRAKRFREDLYFRLNVVTLDLPPLRDRQNDVILLAEFFLTDFCRRARRKTPQLTAAARKRLLEHPWPGNIRELRNLMERLAYLSTEDRIEAEDLAFILSPRGQAPLAADLSLPFVDATTRFQVEYIRRQIDQSAGNMSLAATRLGLHRSNLYRKMRQLGMETS
jgi:transcriptional regulator with GAF, ATPase, and Fis domain